MKNWIFSGYKYTTTTDINWGNIEDLQRIARRENRQLKDQRRIERCVVYPVPGTMPGIGQLCILR